MVRHYVANQIRKYNYVSWLEYINTHWSFAALGTSVIDLGCNKGDFLRNLNSYSPLTNVLGLDLDDSISANILSGDQLETSKFGVADFCHPSFSDVELGEADTAYFMNMPYVLPDLSIVTKKLRNSSFQNLIVSYPLPNSLDIYDIHNPGQNFRENSFDDFLLDAGFEIYLEADVTANYYLDNLKFILIASINKFLIQLFERNGKKRFYRLVWAKRICGL